MTSVRLKGVALSFIAFVVLVYVLWLLQDIFIPIAYAAIFAIILSPVVNFLLRKKWHIIPSIVMVMTLSTLLLATLVFLLFSQFGRLADNWPMLSQRFSEMMDNAVQWISVYFDIRIRDINKRIEAETANLLFNNNALIGNTLQSFGGAMAALFLMPVYVFMFLFYKARIVEFSHRLFGRTNDSTVSEVLVQTKGIIQGYLYGLAAEVAILAVLNTAGLFILGIDYAILLGIAGALLNIIPYIGGLVAVLVYMAVALVTKSSDYVLWVVLLYSVIQFIDNNYIVPKIIGSKVKLNALFSLLAVITGAALWGIAGMFLSIPVLAICKLLFDRMPRFMPFGYLLGDTISPRPK